MTRVIPSERRQNETHPRPHEHGWTVESRHPTSDGHVVYVRCIDCGARRVDLQARSRAMPAAVSVELLPRGDGAVP